MELSPDSCAEPTLEASRDAHQAWYATYTCSRHEKQVARSLEERDLEHFLPLYQVRRRHTHGGQRLFLPLFPGYVFVHIAIEDQLRVLQVPGVVHLVSFNGKPAPLQDSEIATLQNTLTRSLTVEPYPYLKVNHEVEVRSGPLQGLRGKILHRKGRFRVILSVELLHQSVAVDIDAGDLGYVFR